VRVAKPNGSSSAAAGPPRRRLNSPSLGHRRPTEGLLTYERELPRIQNRVHGDIDVEVWPIEMVRLGSFHVQHAANRRVPKPREVLK
jgi:hypothetical protein